LFVLLFPGLSSHGQCFRAAEPSGAAAQRLPAMPRRREAVAARIRSRPWLCASAHVPRWVSPKLLHVLVIDPSLRPAAASSNPAVCRTPRRAQIFRLSPAGSGVLIVENTPPANMPDMFAGGGENACAIPTLSLWRARTVRRQNLCTAVYAHKSVSTKAFRQTGLRPGGQRFTDRPCRDRPSRRTWQVGGYRERRNRRSDSGAIGRRKQAGLTHLAVASRRTHRAAHPERTHPTNPKV
jgi:hypothetical protein